MLPSIISSTTFEHVNQQTIDITSITEMSPDTEIADLSGNAFGDHANGIPVTFFTGFPNLWKLDLRQNKLNEDDLPDGVFSGVAGSLTYLVLIGNQLTLIRSQLLKDLNKLEVLYLYYNIITAIEQGKNSL